ncbi:hypothetical protein DV737_g1613, partial [Chaetothyriales sp. CBS 132003]
MEEDDDGEDVESEGPSPTLRSLQQESEARDSPNSLTSSSIMSSHSEQNPGLTPQSNTQVSGSSLPYLYMRALATCKAKSSIPHRLSASDYASQCITAAENSRLNPFQLHEEEHKLLQDKLCQLHVTVYLNIRNGILRLWTRNPSVSVSLEEAIGCVKDERYTRLACFAYEWLVRRGYINFGCVAPPVANKTGKGKQNSGETIVIIGGGVAGLSAARHLTSLFHHFPDRAPPKIIVLEGRSRLGGRIYSHPLTSMRSTILSKEQRPTAEMGAHIIVGFEKGNPLDVIIRGQLALDYHLLRDISTLYDIDGSPVNPHSDAMIERLYNDILDRAGTYRVSHTIKKTAQGDKDLIEAGRDPPEEDSITIKQYEEATASGTIDQLLSTRKSRRRGAGHRAAKDTKSQEEVDASMETKTQLPAAQAAKEFGFMLRKTTGLHETLQLDDLAQQQNQSLGKVMASSVEQYQHFLDLKPYALRLMNWHFANLEYANAANVDKLSLRGWDQDIGNEFEGEHAQVVGGYQQLPRALWRHPEPLDVRTNKAVKTIKYKAGVSQGHGTVVCEDGESLDADRIVLTASLGVLKEETIQFDPPLPQWKRDAIRRMGFGLLNKLILVFERPFWDTERDMFGILREPRSGDGGKHEDYKQGRGQFYLFWNTIDTSGLPVLIALMAGDSAHEAEKTPDSEIVADCVDQLRRIFGHNNVPQPLETIVTRWGSDRFARGTYSYVAAEARPGDYDLIAAPVPNLFFAGEATIATHPATVHGAYLSGLRAANEVYESLVGPIAIPPTLVPPVIKSTSIPTSQPTPRPSDLKMVDTHLVQQPKRKGDPVLPVGTFSRPVKEKDKSLTEAYDAAMWVRIYDDLGPPPPKPAKHNINSFLMFSGDHWESVKARLTEEREKLHKKPKQSERDQVRVELGRMWSRLPQEEKAKYTEQAKKNREENDRTFKEWHEKAKEWDRRTWEVKAVWVAEGNSFEQWCQRVRDEEAGIERKRTKL